jgi:hypothetical protein
VTRRQRQHQQGGGQNQEAKANNRAGCGFHNEAKL